MAKDNSNSFNHSIPIDKEPDSNKSFVRKVRSRVSELIPSSLSKWFSNDTGSSSSSNCNNIRQRDDDDDDDEEYFEIQPPSKRARKPSPITSHNNVHMSLQSTSIHNVNDVNHELDSEASTSGYSSMIRLNNKAAANIEKPKEADIETPSVTPTKLNDSLTAKSHSRSLFVERSLSPHMNSSLSSRRPSFNVSTFGSPSFVDRTLSTQRIINSPFYNGRTTYGGASAYGKSPKNRRAIIKNQVEVKPTNQGDSTTLSRTARRILSTLEQFTSPTTDAKKIPNPLGKRSQADGLLSKYTGANPYLIRDKIMSASSTELQVPSVPDLLKMKLKERLQDSTVAVRQIATTSKSTLNADEYKIRTAEDTTTKHTNKMKNKITSVRQKQNLPVLEEVKLPEISLPITTLPKFDFSLPLPPSCTKHPAPVSHNETESVVMKKVLPEMKDIPKNADTHEYKFATPLILAENLISIIPINDFKFSEPVIKQKGGKTVIADTAPIVLSSVKEVFLDPKKEPTKWEPSGTSTWKCSWCLQENKLDRSSCINCNTSKTGTKRKMNLETVTTPGFGNWNKKSGDEWECSMCFVRNPQDKTKCMACETEKSEDKKSKVTSKSLNKSEIIDAIMNKITDDWSCSTCGMPNAPEKKKCMVCDTPKPENKNAATTDNKFGDAFKKKENEWECPICMIRNSSDKTKCAACETVKPGTATLKPSIEISSTTIGFGEAFKKKSGEWECGSCMVRNGSDAPKCVACETPKSGTSNFGPVSSTTGFGQTFKRKCDEWECNTCMVRNSNEKTKCVACETPKPGVNSASVQETKSSTTATAPMFKFGIVPTSATKVSDSSSGFSLAKPTTQPDKNAEAQKFVFNSTAVANTVNTSSIPTFTFGILPKTSTPALEIKPKEEDVTFKPQTSIAASQTKPKETEVMFKAPEKSTAGFVFGINSPANAAKSTVPSISVNKSENKPKQPVFSFGTNLSEPDYAKQPTENMIEKPAPTQTGFTFGTSLTPQKIATSVPVEMKQTSASSIIFSPPKQPLVTPNRIETTMTSLQARNDKDIFGNLTAKPTVSSSSFTFNSPTTTSTPIFAFGAKTASTSAPAGNTTTTATAEMPVFKFNTPQQQQHNADGFSKPAVTNIFSNPPTRLIFGTPSKPPAFESPAKPAFEAPPAFGSEFGSAAAPLSGFGSTTVPPSAFGPCSIPGPGRGFGTSSAPSSGFGSSVNTVAPPPFGLATTTTAPAFGTAITTTTSGFGSIPSSGFGTASSGFGSASTGLSTTGFESAPNAFPFGARPNEEPAKASMFTFGQQKPPEPAKQAAVYNFAGNLPQNSTPVAPGFSFNPAPNAPPPFNFNAGNKMENPSPFQPQPAAPQTNIFGSPTQPLQQQQQQQPAPMQNGGFNFGNTNMNSNVKAGFNFGGAPPQFNAPTQPGVFSFGAPNQNPAPPPAAAGFNFGPSNNAAAPAFNANLKPTFNFSGGTTPTFSAQPGAESPAVAQRRRLKATRRTQPR